MSGLYTYVLPYLAGATSKEKTVPSFIFDLNADYRNIFLETLFKGDGYVDTNSGRISYSSMSDKLLTSISLLSVSNGWRIRVVPKSKGRAGTLLIYKHPRKKLDIILQDAAGVPVYEINDYHNGWDWEYDVSVDIKPGSCPNPLNVRSRGVLPVAVLGTEEFDVTTIDPDTIVMAREGIDGEVHVIRYSYEDIATPFEGELCDCDTLDNEDDLNGDGIEDLTLKFKMQEIVELLGLTEFESMETIPLIIMGETFDGIPEKEMDKLIHYDWPGNVRELENIIERGVILNPGPRFRMPDLMVGEDSKRGREGNVTLNENERHHILWALEKTGWKIRGKSGAAELLDIHPSTLQFRMKKLGIKRGTGKE